MHCIATCPRNAVDPAPDFALPLMGYTSFMQALEAMGVERHDAQRLISESGRSPTILRRRLSCVPAIRRPPWASDHSLARCLIPICLVGAWHAHKSADQGVLAKLTGCEYEELERNIATLRQVEEDCPVWAVGQHRGVISKIDVLFAIAPLMTEQDIGKFLRIAEDVLSEPDPALELPESDRWMAAVHDKVRDHSAALRRRHLRDASPLVRAWRWSVPRTPRHRHRGAGLRSRHSAADTFGSDTAISGTRSRHLC